MKKGLSRTRMRLAVVLFLVGVVLLLSGEIVEGWYTMIPGLILIIVGFIIRPSTCPTCGKYGAPAPQWSQPGKYHCRYCGARFAYDDETDDEPED